MLTLLNNINPRAIAPPDQTDHWARSWRHAVEARL